MHKGGNISVNAAAAAKLGVTEPTNVVFVYDEEHKRIGIRIAPEGSANQYMLRQQPKSRSFIVGGGAFCRFHGINTDAARRYDAKMYGPNVLGFSLDDDSLHAGGSPV